MKVHVYVSICTYLSSDILERVYVYGQGQFQLAQKTAGGGQGIHRTAQHFWFRVHAPQTSREHNFGRGDGCRGEDVARF